MRNIEHNSQYIRISNVVDIMATNVEVKKSKKILIIVLYILLPSPLYVLPKFSFTRNL